MPRSDVEKKLLDLAKKHPVDFRKPELVSDKSLRFTDEQKLAHRSLNLSTGEVELREPEQVFIDWLCGERLEGESYQDFADRYGVNVKTLRDWRKNPAFLRKWEEQALGSFAAPDRQSELLEKLFEKGQLGDPKAIELYFKLIDKMTPDRVEVTTTGSEMGAMTDAELRRLLSSDA